MPQIEAALRFYREKTHPGSRMPTWGEHDVTQRWYERAPLDLKENGKRERVVKALERALKEFTEPGSVEGQALGQTRKM